MQIKISRITQLLVKTCRHLLVPEVHIPIIVNHYLEGELKGKVTHGIAKFCFESQFFHERIKSPEVITSNGPIIKINANKEIGPIAANYATEKAIEISKMMGICIVGMSNSQRYGVLSTWVEQIAKKGLLALAMNTSPAESTIPGVKSGLLGMNTLAYAAPTEDEPIIFDMTSGIKPMGLLWESKSKSLELPPNSFLDSQGRFTTNSKLAKYSAIFGGHKGFGISLLIQILTGSLFNFPMGQEIKSAYDTGYIFMAIRPEKEKSFKKGNQNLASIIREIALNEGASNLKVPGDQSRKIKLKNISEGHIDLDQITYNQLKIITYGKFAK